MRRLWTHLAALVGALIGFYAGFLILLATGGLDSASLVPLFASTGSGLVAGIAVAVVGSAGTVRVGSIGLIGGLLLGATLTAIDPDLTVVAIVLAVFSQVLAQLGRSVGAASEGTRAADVDR